MGRKTAKERRQALLSDLSRKELENHELSDFFDELSDGSERACALVGCAFLDHELKRCIETKFVKLTKTENKQLFASKGAPLGDFAAKIDIAYALGMYPDEMRDDLHRIRNIRNAFGHAPRPVKFTTSVIAEECDALTCTVIGFERDSRMRFIHFVLDTAVFLGKFMQGHFEQARRDVEKQVLIEALTQGASSRPTSPGK